MDWVHVMAGFFGKEICLFRTEEERERERETGSNCHVSVR